MTMVKQQTTTGCTAKKKANSPHQPTGQWIRPESRLAIYLRDSFRCLVCCRDLHDADPRDITLDHITPKVDGGNNKPENLYTCCRTCNCSRQDQPLARFVGPETRADIRRNTKRSMTKYRKLAKALISGETGFEATLKAL
jgi:5-methylcytosine-specific restriction endonuclease McrA